MKPHHLLVVALIALRASAHAGVDVGKGTDIIPPDSKEASDIHKSDNARKTAPKDNSYEKTGTQDKFNKVDLKASPQKDSSEDRTLDESSSDISVPGADDHPVVLNDYDPNNLGKEKDKNEKEKEKEKTDKTAENDKTSKKEDASSSSSSSGSSSSSSTDTTSTTSGTSKSKEGTGGANSPVAGGNDSLHSFYMSFSMIIFSEIGDKTFLIAALMAMKHARVVVFTAAFGSLIVMTVLSALLGHALPSILPKKATSFMAAILFIVFGIRLLIEGLGMDASLGVEEEMEEVEEEIKDKEFTTKQDDLERGFGEKGELRRSSSNPKVTDDGLESGNNDLYKVRPKHSNASTAKQIGEGVSNLAALVLSPVWVSVFVMTFLGEWGDRSQVATIAMAAGSDYWLVILGAIAGHGICTAAAVIGGKLLAQKISMKTVTISGAIAFLIFAVIYFIEGYSLSW